MQITKKEEFEFLPQEALKNVQITARPYPLREQKLIARGEDIAYLREAILERNAFYYIPNNYNKVNTKRIQRTVGDYRNDFDAIKLLLSRGWVDGEKLLKIEDLGPIVEDRIDEERDKRINEFESLKITKLFSQKWFDRLLQYEMASTAKNRLFADCERMNVASNLTPSYFFRSAWKYDGEFGKSYHDREQPNYPIEYWNSDLDVAEQAKFYYLYGNRYDMDKIEMITVDAVIKRTEYSGEGNTKKLHFFIAKLKFLPEKIADEKSCKEWDEADDTYNEAVDELREECDNEIKKARETYEESEETARVTLDKALSKAIENETEAKKRAHITYVDEVKQINELINSRIVLWRDSNESSNNAVPDEIVLEWIRLTTDALKNKQSAQEKASQQRVAAEEEAYSVFEQSLVQPKEELDKAIQRLEEQFEKDKATEVSKRDKKQEEISNRYATEMAEINTRYSNAIKNATNVRNEATNAAYNVASQKLNESFREGVYTWDGDGYMFPRFIEDYVPTEEEEEIMFSVRNTLFDALTKADDDYKAAEDVALNARWEARRSLLPFYPNFRKIFSCTIHKYGEMTLDYGSLEIAEPFNIAIHFKPKSALGMDISEYRKEQEKEEEKEEGSKG